MQNKCACVCVHVLALTASIHEGFGLPAGEAMACGAPLIASDGGALPEVVGDAGVQVKAGDVDELARALDSLLADEVARARLSELARQRIVVKFSWKVAAQQMTAYYRAAI